MKSSSCRCDTASFLQVKPFYSASLSKYLTGSVAIYDTSDDFSLVAEIQLGPVGNTLVNDVIIHPRAKYAYITDSLQLQFYRVRAGGRT